MFLIHAAKSEGFYWIPSEPQKQVQKGRKDQNIGDQYFAFCADQQKTTSVNVKVHI